LETGYNDVLKTVLSHAWFSRIWVVQEVVVSKDLSIQYGERGIPWDDFCRTLFLYFHPRQDLKDGTTEAGTDSEALESLQSLAGDNDIIDIKLGWQTVATENPAWKQIIQPVREMCQMQLIYRGLGGNSEAHIPQWLLNDKLAHFITDDAEFRQGSLRLQHLLARGRRCDATDPRDKVLALIGISTGFNSQDLDSLVDYNKPDDQVFREATRLILEHEGTYDILSQAGQLSIVEVPRFSSWAGKWSEKSFPPLSVLSRLGGESSDLVEKRSRIVKEHHTWSEDGRILACTGGRVGQLVATSPLGLPRYPEITDIQAERYRYLDLLRKFQACAIELLKLVRWPGDEFEGKALNITYDERGLPNGGIIVKIWSGTPPLI
jgi:hypothetical protein